MESHPAIALLLSAALAAPAAQAAEKRVAPELRTILVEESYRPQGAARRGDTVLDLAENAAYQLRKARKVLTDAGVWSTGTERPKDHWTSVEAYLGRLESTYKTSVYPGLDELGLALVRSRETTVNIDIQLKERELFAKLDTPDGPQSSKGFGPENPLGLRPSKQALQSLRARREQSEAPLLKATTLLERGLAQLKDPAAKALGLNWYMEDLIVEAHQSLLRAAEAALVVANTEQEIIRKGGPCWRAIDALEAYGGPSGKGSFSAERRDKAVELSNAAKRVNVENEYRFAVRPEEARTWDYILETFAKL